MTHKEILTKAIQKAFDSGWEPSDGLGMWVYKTGFTEEEQYGHIYEMNGLSDLIFNVDFAKALWGNQLILTRPDTYGQLTRVHQGLPVQKPEPSRLEALLVEAWRYHLQRMVVAKDAIKYLGENI